ncbi:Ger(x)C family spore germination protein ['Paenibacillus yunnanensis' Narsing Rao et al. 2020]|uniref:Ger(x)C family spore germination protein n=1 Tax=Paenibacillus tengchongensis TaxID=2608684 RepID=UPI00124C7F38|nr:Ger(x)C family spore germination protein [Paenibacillus tengchongensis]
MNRRGSSFLAAMLAAMLALTGCYNSRELNELAIVSGIGIDLVPGKEDYKVTFQIVNPKSTPTTVSPGSGLPAIVVISATDRTVFGALRKASKRATRQLFFAHTQLVAIGEPLARRGINHVFDIFERSHELRLNSAALVVRGGSAESLLQMLSPIESISSLGLVNKVENTAKVWGENRRTDVFGLISGIAGEGDITVNGVMLPGDIREGRKKSSLEQSDFKGGSIMSGLAVLKEGRLTGWMEGTDARGTQWLLDEIKETGMDIGVPGASGKLAVNIFHSSTGVRVELREGVPVFHVRIREEGNVSEAGAFVDFSIKEVMDQVQETLKTQTAQEVRQAFEKAQGMKCDIFNFGNELKRTHPQDWQKVMNHWDEAFAQGRLDLHVEAYIRSTGMRTKTYMGQEN